MHPSLHLELERLRKDHLDVHGRPFKTFSCPITQLDEDVELCRAHIVNQAFSDSSRAWTIQRKDVDNFYGGIFEGPFLDLQLKIDGVSALDALIDRNLRSRLKPKLYINGAAVQYFVPNNLSPLSYPRVKIITSKGEVELALKIDNDSLSIGDIKPKVEVEIKKDFRIEAFVSVLKAAHLTMFKILGYQYASSIGGHFLGREILGQFFLQHRGRKAKDVIVSAQEYFSPYQCLARPIIQTSIPFSGTVDDSQLLVCRALDGGIWAAIILVKVSSFLCAVLVPIHSGHDEKVRFKQFVRFLEMGPSHLDVSHMKLVEDGSQWEINASRNRLNWPENGRLFGM